MALEKLPTPSKIPVVAEEPVKSKTKTKWRALASAKLWPKEIVCRGYRSFHRVDVSCKGRVIPAVNNLKNHMKNCSDDIGTGFEMILEKHDIPCPLWAELEEAGIEAIDFRCDVCNAIMPFNHIHVLNHMRPHSGKTRKVRPGGKFQFTLSFNVPFIEDEF